MEVDGPAKTELISVIDIAAKHRVRKQTVFKWIKRLGLETIKHASADNKGQAISYVSTDDYHQLVEYFVEPTELSATSPMIDTSDGVFYVIQLEPDFDPGRFKLGFASTMSERLRAHKTAAPFSVLVKAWPCKPLWEKTAIDCATSDCEQIYTEVFRTDDINNVVDRCERFFELMPDLRSTTE